jgi:hypothetical protein
MVTNVLKDPAVSSNFGNGEGTLKLVAAGLSETVVLIYQT